MNGNIATEQHTTGPLTVERNGSANHCDIYDADGFAIAGNVLQHHARRLAACWNACEGLPTERLETAPPIAERITIAIAAGDNLDAELAKRNDELAAARALQAQLVQALADATDSLEYVERTMPGAVGCGVRAERIKAARAALAAAGDFSQSAPTSAPAAGAEQADRAAAANAVILPKLPPFGIDVFRIEGFKAEQMEQYARDAVALNSAASTSSADDCKTCDGTSVDPGGLPMCRDCAPASAPMAKHMNQPTAQPEIDYSILSAYADKHRLHFNGLCAMVRGACRTPAADAGGLDGLKRYAIYPFYDGTEECEEPDGEWVKFEDVKAILSNRAPATSAGGRTDAERLDWLEENCATLTRMYDDSAYILAINGRAQRADRSARGAIDFAMDRDRAAAQGADGQGGAA